MVTIPYTYCLSWSTHDKHYYGVRFAKECNPEELMQSYFTSSRHVKTFIKQNGLPDVVVIRRTFKDEETARDWESKVLRRMSVVKDPRWLNRTNNKAIDPVLAKHGWSKESREKASQSHKRKPSGMAGKKLSDATRIKMSLAHIGKRHSEKTKILMAENQRNGGYRLGIKSCDTKQRKKIRIDLLTQK